MGSLPQKARQLEKNTKQNFAFYGLTSFSQLRKDAGIESLQERRMSASFLFLLDALQKIFNHFSNTTLKSSIIQDKIQICILLKNKCPLQFFLASHHPKAKANDFYPYFALSILTFLVI